MSLSRVRIVALLSITLLTQFPAISLVKGQQKSEAKSRVDLGAFVKELMVLKMEGDQSQIAIWFPFEFFLESNLAESGANRAETERELAFLKPFHTITIQCSVEQPDGSSLYASEKEVRSRAFLKLEDGTELLPVDKVPPLVSATVAAMKTLIEAEGDAGSANMHILIFPSTKANKPVVDSSKKSKLTLVLRADKRFSPVTITWRTPFDSVNPSSFCSRCKEPLSAKWSYCAWCGASIDIKR